MVESPNDFVDLYWLPLGAGGSSVRINGKVFEAVASRLQHRGAMALYHSALIVGCDGVEYAIEQTPAGRPPAASRGVVASAPVGMRSAGRIRIFRYEIRCWAGGAIPDINEAVESPQRLSQNDDRAARVIDGIRAVPTPVWGRDELGAGEMWNSNSVIAWVLERAGFDAAKIPFPTGGRAPGWAAGWRVARRDGALDQ